MGFQVAGCEVASLRWRQKKRFLEHFRKWNEFLYKKFLGRLKILYLEGKIANLIKLFRRYFFFRGVGHSLKW